MFPGKSLLGFHNSDYLFFFLYRSTFNKETSTAGQAAQPQQIPSRIYVSLSDEPFEINKETDIRNICALINNMEQIPIESVRAEYITTGYFEYGKEKKDFILGPEFFILGDKAYAGSSECKSVWSIVEKHDRNLERLLGILGESNEIRIYANDLDMDINLKSEQIEALLSIIGNSELHNISWEGQLTPDYPDYLIELPQKNKDGINYNISLVNKSLLAAKFERIHTYHCNPGLFDFIQSLMNAEAPKIEDGAAYLFNAEKVEILEHDLSGDYSQYSASIARILNKAIETDQRENLGDIKLKMKFTIDGESYEIIIYENNFVFNEKTYYRKGIYSDLLNMLRAG